MALSQALSHVPHLTIVIPLLCLAIFSIVQFALRYFSTQARRLRALPSISEQDDIKLRKTAQQAYQQYGKAGNYYKLKEKAHEIVMIPPRLMNELKALPQTEVSFSEELYERYNGELTGMGRFEPSFIKTISGDLTKRIPQMMGELAEETEYAFNTILGQADTPASVTALPAFQRIVGLLSSRVLVGSPLCHDDKWLDSMITHANYTFSVSQSVWKYPAWIRNYIAPYMKEFKTMAANKKEVERMLAPLVLARQKGAFEEKSDEFDDILQRLIQNAPADKKADVGYHAHNQLEMSAAGLHTTAQVLTQVVFNLAAYPECYKELREELQQVLQHSSEPRTLILSKAGLAKLIKLDSFMKETQRTNPLGILSMNRKVTSPNGHTMSNSLHLPYGQFTAVNSYHIMNDTDFYPEPEKFDGFRFAKLHSLGGLNATKYQFTTVNPEFPAFGLGTHSCPGRFFAGTEIKIVAAYILLNYNVAFESGQARPANNTLGVLQAPNGQAKLIFTPLSDEWSLTGDEE